MRLLPFSRESDEHVQNRVMFLERVREREKGEITVLWEVDTDIEQKYSQKGTFSSSKIEFCRFFFNPSTFMMSVTL